MLNVLIDKQKNKTSLSSHLAYLLLLGILSDVHIKFMHVCMHALDWNLFILGKGDFQQNPPPTKIFKF